MTAASKQVTPAPSGLQWTQADVAKLRAMHKALPGHDDCPAVIVSFGIDHSTEGYQPRLRVYHNVRVALRDACAADLDGTRVTWNGHLFKRDLAGAMGDPLPDETEARADLLDLRSFEQQETRDVVDVIPDADEEVA